MILDTCHLHKSHAYAERQNSNLICLNEEQRKVIEMLRTELTKKDEELLSTGSFILKKLLSTFSFVYKAVAEYM